MNKDIPVIKNEEYIVDITGMGFEGEGIGKVDNFTVFIPEAIVGEKVKIKVISIKKNYAYGKLLEIIEVSPSRETPICKIYNRCGGCHIQHLNYECQLELKKKRVVDAVERIGKLQDVVVHDTIGMNNPYRYRNKVQLPVGKDSKGEVVVGFYAQRSHNIINMQTCFIQDEVSDYIIGLIKNWMIENNIQSYDEMKHSGVVRHIMVRKAFKTGQVMVVLVTNGTKLPNKSELVDLLVKNVQGIRSIIQSVNTKKTNVILGEECSTLWGDDVITDYIGDFKFNISPLSFFQVNPTQTEVLYNKTLEYAGLNGDEIVFDAYCGTGTISLFLSKKAKKVYGVEIIPQAIENAVENAKMNNVENVEFIVGKSEEQIPELIRNGIKPDVVVVDPPRKGCEESLIRSIAESNPEKVIYVSCDPGTLARDLGIFLENGYRTLEIQPVDMFPQTAHVETVVKLQRKHS